MNKLLAVVLMSALLTACEESSTGEMGTTSSDDLLCVATLKTAIRETLVGATEISNRVNEVDACSTSFKLNEAYYQVKLDLSALGTADDMKRVGVTEMSQFELLKKTTLFYKNQEEIAKLGDYAVYYTKGGNDELMVKSGGNVIQLMVFNEMSKSYDKAVAVKVASSVLTALAK